MEFPDFITTIPISLTDVFTVGPIIILVILLFYFSNLEIKKSLEQSKLAQEILSKDRDVLQNKLEESKQALREARLTRLNELAKSAEFGRLSQGLFHDLMTPLTSIILHTEKLQETEVKERHVKKAVEASRRMAAYIKDMRATLSREESERTCLLHEEASNVMHLLTYTAREKGVELVLSNKTACEWYGSPMKLRQIFSNLISNALDACAAVTGREKRVVITMQRSADNNQIIIEDNGCGIPADVLPKIFEPFFTTKPYDKGTGIGLATVKNIVEKNLKGTLEIQSEIGKGTRVSVTFPPGSRDPGAYHPHPQRVPPLV